ncbi:LPXTG cell wall anchor domain-containing protein [Saccharothrix longispora]|uniref:LPXTG cell wall anchor domain-containing protein n=1 Tax=Saccharothrix longispora TaxID=33920 RepID=UPI0028FD4A37|nr:LPXTG cell wall anchor domain-containing protein [Saccharothrix longispora]MDU0294740.1 LPXTG cell wall anchor domain-containing protein [Saccharothrix longispora]
MNLIVRSLTGAALLLALATGTAAAAPPEQAPPQSGDDRATAHVGNVDIGQPGNACEVVGLPGDEGTLPAGTFTSDGTYLDVIALPEGSTITGVVVKGGDNYNVYPNLGDLPWTDLHAPLNNGGNVPGISHWFACLSERTTTTTAAGTTTDVAGTGATTTTTPAPAVVPGESPDELAATGFDGTWLLISGLALVAAGLAVVLTLRSRRRH